MLEGSQRPGGGLEHQELSHQAAGVREALRKETRFREQQQARRFRPVGAQDNRFRLLETLPLLGIEVDSPVDAPLLVGRDLSHVAVRADLAAARVFGHGDDAGQRARLSSHLTTEPFAEPAVYARGAAGERVREDGHGRGEGVPAELLRGALQQDT